MSGCVVSNDVALGHDTPNDLRPSGDVATNEKKRRLGTMLRKTVKDSRCPRRIWPIIERQCRNALSGLNTDDRLKPRLNFMRVHHARQTCGQRRSHLYQPDGSIGSCRSLATDSFTRLPMRQESVKMSPPLCEG
jgi:hypothetical protein